MRYTVHHTSSQKTGIDGVLKNIPFLSEHKPDEGKYPYLGEGYYWWEYNAEYAKVWGHMNYDGNFFVTEAEINLNEEDETFLDLGGNRKHMMGFLSMLKEFGIVDGNDVQGINMNYVIEYLKEISQFPFNVIRAIDAKDDKKAMKIQFKEGSSSHMFLNPRIIICYLFKKDIQYKMKPFVIFAS